MVTKIPITLAGSIQLKEELKKLKSEDRPNVIAAIAEAREHGDLSENAEYHAAREKQSFIEGRIQELEDKTSRMDIIDPTKMSGEVIRFSATVQVVDEDTDEEHTYQIVGEDETDFEKGKLSLTAPISRGLIGKSVGDVVEIRTPKGEKSYEILKIEYK